MDDSNTTNQKNNEYENSKIPSHAKKGFITILAVMLGYGLFPSTINTGGIVAGSFDLPMFFLIIFIGSLFLTIYALLLSFIGINNRSSLANLSKRTFGMKGYKLTSIVLIISQIGWFGVGVMFVSQSLISLLGANDLTGIQYFYFWLLTTLIGILITSSAFFGVKALKIASLIAIPLVLGTGIFMSILAINGGSWGTFDPIAKNPNEISAFTAIGLVIATFISGATLIPDFIRWAKSKTQATTVIILTFLVLQVILLTFGGLAQYGVIFDDNQSITMSSTLLIMGFGGLGLVALFANVWTSNDNSLYSTSLSLSSIVSIKKKYAVIILGTLGTLLAPLFISNGFIIFLNILSYLIPGIGSIIIVDYYLIYRFSKQHKTDEYFSFNHEYKNFNYLGICSWILGVIVTLIMQIFVPFIIPIYILIFTSLIYLLAHFIEKLVHPTNEPIKI